MEHRATGNGEVETFPESSGEGRWLTYDEISEIRGIGRESAVKLVQRERLARRPGNDGTARVFVPLEWLKPARARSPEASGEVFRAISVLETAVSALREQAEHERARADRAEAAREAERSRADAARAQAEELRQALGAAEASKTAEAERARQALADLQAERAGHDATRAAAVEHRAARQAAEDTAATLRREANELHTKAERAVARAEAESKQVKALTASLEQANRDAAERSKSLLRRLRWALTRR